MTGGGEAEVAGEAVTGPIVVLIGAPLPPPYGGIARYMQLCLPALARKGYRLRIVHRTRRPRPSPWPACRRTQT